MENGMSKQTETIIKAYGHMPKDIGLNFDLDIMPWFRGTRYGWIKLNRKVLTPVKRSTILNAINLKEFYMGFFDKAEQVIHRVEATLESDVHQVFAKAKQAALDANANVDRLKAELQTALAEARDLHKAAADAAADAAAKAKADALAFEAAIQAHTADMKTQASQIVDQSVPAGTDAQ